MRVQTPRRGLALAAHFFAALGLSSTVFSHSLSMLASPDHLVVYHLSGSAFLLFAPVIEDVILLALACFGLFVAIRPGTKLYRTTWFSALCFYPWVLIRNAYQVLDLPFSHRESVVIVALCAIAYLLVASTSRFESGPRLNEFGNLGLVVLTSVGICGVLAVADLTWLAFKARHLNDYTVADTVARSAIARPRNRVLWIVLDELAFRQVYERRLPNLRLAAFDQFRAQSTIFSNVQAAGIRTEIVPPLS